MVVLEMNEASSGASGRNEGLVVMGRYYAMVKGTVEHHLARVRRDLSPEQRSRLAAKFASAYSKSAYKNADIIEQTIREEGFDCDYARAGWIQGGGDAAGLAEDVRLGREAGFDDYTTMSPRGGRGAGRHQAQRRRWLFPADRLVAPRALGLVPAERGADKGQRRPLHAYQGPGRQGHGRILRGAHRPGHSQGSARDQRHRVVHSNAPSRAAGRPEAPPDAGGIR